MARQSDRIDLLHAVQQRDVSTVSRLLQSPDITTHDLNVASGWSVIHRHGDVLRTLLSAKDSVGTFRRHFTSTYSTPELFGSSIFACLIELQRRGVEEAAAHAKTHVEIALVIDIFDITPMDLMPLLRDSDAAAICVQIMTE